MKKNIVKINENTLRKMVAESIKRALNEFEGGQNYSAMERMMFNVVCEEVDAPTVLHAIDAILGREQFHEVLDYLYSTSKFSRTAKPNWPKDHMRSSMGNSTVES